MPFLAGFCYLFVYLSYSSLLPHTQLLKVLSNKKKKTKKKGTVPAQSATASLTTSSETGKQLLKIIQRDSSPPSVTIANNPLHAHEERQLDATLGHPFLNFRFRNAAILDAVSLVK